MKEIPGERLSLDLWGIYIDASGVMHLDFNDVDPPSGTGWSQVEANYIVPQQVVDAARKKFNIKPFSTLVGALLELEKEMQLEIINFLRDQSPKPFVWMSTDWSE